MGQSKGAYTPKSLNKWCSWSGLGVNPGNLLKSLVVTTPVSVHGYVKPMRMDSVVDVNDIDGFISCKARKKILWVTPDHWLQLSRTAPFDLFVNTEPFGEMQSDVLANYLKFAKAHLKSDGTLFLVNRFSR